MMRIPTRNNPPLDCALCPRLVSYRESNRAKYPEYHNAPAPVWGPDDARLLIVGLAPGLHGANRSGRPFTGDASGDLLLPALERAGLLSEGDLVQTAITNAVACAPPENRVIAAEVNACRPFLRSALASPSVVLALGGVAHKAVLRALGGAPKDARFAHRAQAAVMGKTLIASYHPSRYNVSTGRITSKMLDAALADCRRALDRDAPPKSELSQ